MSSTRGPRHGLGDVGAGEARGILDDLLGDLPGVVYRCRNDPSWTMLGISDSVEELTGYAPDRFLGAGALAFADLIHPEDRDRVWEAIQPAVERRGTFRVTYRLVPRSGEPRWVLEQGRAVRRDGEDLLTGYIQDVTEPLARRLGQKEVELGDVRRQARYLELLQTVTAIVNREEVLDAALLASLQAITSALGFAVGHAWVESVPGSGAIRSTGIWVLDGGDLEPFRQWTEAEGWDRGEGLPGRVLAAGRAEWVEDVRRDPSFLRVPADGESPLTSGVAAPVMSGARTLAVVELYARERRPQDPEVMVLLEQVGIQLGRVMEREEAFRERQAMQERFRQIAEHIEDVFWISSADKREIEYVSPAYERVWGESRASLYEDPSRWLERIHPEDREELRPALPHQTEGGYEQEYRVVRPDGEVRWIWDRAFPVREEDGEVVRIVGVAEDITERRTLETQLFKAQKMEAVGRLAGGIAHDFNNILTVIRSQADLLLLDSGLPDTLREEVELMRASADRAAGLTRQLLAFSREQVLRPRVVDLNDILRGMERLLRRVLGEDIRIRVELAPGLPCIRVDPGQLEQVVMNLAVNARDAMPEGGVLTLSTREEEVGAEEAAGFPGLEPGPHVSLDVADTGHGMDEDTRAHIFEPFFTTKKALGGTGLGLAMCYGIVKQSGGAIHVESAPGEGATFTVRFPPTEGRPTTCEEPELRGGEGELTGTVLVVEDDPSVRRVAVRILERAGFEVREAGEVETGLRILAEGRGGVHVVLTDLVLPGMGGRELVELARERFPEVGLVVMSGYAEGSPGSRQDLPAEVAFIQKPFTPAGLVQAVREVLGG